MRCRNFFSAAIRQGSGAWPPFPDNNSWICLFFTPALSHHCLVSPFHPLSTPSFLSVCLPPLSFLSFSMSISPTEICAADCGGHGICVSGTCRCDDGWMGTGCDQRACHPRCNEHGTCKDGKCECSPGWNGEHCTIGRMGRGLGFGLGGDCVCVCIYLCAWKGLGGQQRHWLSVCLRVNEAKGVRVRVQLEKRRKSMLN